ncbi:MAG TPA: hypothetical protein VFF04_04365 [Candidatus Babeliales bacterium]|nr:hypothetical protein [Candidatus Babeliales bacterium]
MENNNNSSSINQNTNQFVLSYELLSLLQWMVEHDAQTLKNLIAHALKAGLKQEIQRSDLKNTTQTLEGAQYSVLEFFSLLEALIAETINEHAVQSALEKNLMPAIDQIDSTHCDDATVRRSIEKATAKLEHNPHDNPHDILFKELLKRWKPSKKTVVN